MGNKTESQHLSDDSHSCDILLLFPTFASRDFSDLVFTHHLGASYLLAYLKAKGIRAQQFLKTEPVDLDSLSDEILNRNPKIVGFTCYDTNYYFIKVISQILKTRNPAVLIVIGGPSATFSDMLIMKDNPAVDICVRGYGEEILYELVRRRRTSLESCGLHNITYRTNTRTIRLPDEVRPKGKNESTELDILPSPYLEGILPADGNLGILTSRGCVFRCTYCNFSAMSGWAVSYYSADRVVSELKMIYAASQQASEGDTRLVEIHDDTFSLNIRRAKHICERIIEEKIDLKFWADLRADKIDTELLVLMKQAGVQKVNIGLESAVPRVLRAVKKVGAIPPKKNNLEPEKAFVQKVKESVRLAKEAGLEVSVSVILGLPGATPIDDKRTIDFVNTLDVNDYSHNYLKVYSGTELSKTYNGYGLKTKQPLTLLPRQTLHAYDVYETPMMKNAMQAHLVREQVQRTLVLITGDYGNRRGDAHPDLLLKDHLLSNEAISWLSSFITISPRMLFLHDHAEEDIASRNMARIINSNIPIVNFRLAELSPFKRPNRDAQTREHWTVFPEKESISKELKIMKLRNAAFGMLDNYGHVRLQGDSAKEDIWKGVFLSLSTHDAMKALSNLVLSSERVVLESHLKEYDCYFGDECRWLSADCPAIRFRRLFLHEGECILPCLHGKSIGKIGDGRKEMIERLQRHWFDARHRRGCDTCSAKETCAKCMFPFPVDEEEYCLIVRGIHSDLSGVKKVFELLRIVRRMRSEFDVSRQDIILEGITGLVDESNLSMVDVGEARYYYHHGSDRLFRA